MHEKFQSLTTTIEEIGNMKNGTLDLDVKIEKITLRSENLDTSTVVEDLKRVKAENADLMAQLKAPRREHSTYQNLKMEGDDSVNSV